VAVVVMYCMLLGGGCTHKQLPLNPGSEMCVCVCVCVCVCDGSSIAQRSLGLLRVI